MNTFFSQSINTEKVNILESKNTQLLSTSERKMAPSSKMLLHNDVQYKVFKEIRYTILNLDCFRHSSVVFLPLQLRNLMDWTVQRKPKRSFWLQTSVWIWTAVRARSCRMSWMIAQNWTWMGSTRPPTTATSLSGKVY